MIGGRLAYLYLFLVQCAYGIYPVFIRWSGLSGKEQYLVFWRMVFALAVIAPLVFALGKYRDPSLKKPAIILQLMGGGASIALQTYLFSKAVDLIPASTALFLFQLAPVVVAMVAPILLSEKLERPTIAALALGLGGMAVICFAQGTGGDKGFNTLGIICALAAPCFFAADIMFLKSLRNSLDALTVTFYAFIVATLVALPFTGFNFPALEGKEWASLVVLGAFHTGFLGLAYTYLAKMVKAQHMGAASYIEPVSGTIFAMLIFGEMPVWSTYVGGALIIASGTLVILSQPAEQTAAPPQGD